MTPPEGLLVQLALRVARVSAEATWISGRIDRLVSESDERIRRLQG